MCCEDVASTSTCAPALVTCAVISFHLRPQAAIHSDLSCNALRGGGWNGGANLAHQRNGFQCTDYIDYVSKVGHANLRYKAKQPQ